MPVDPPGNAGEPRGRLEVGRRRRRLQSEALGTRGSPNSRR